MKQDNSYKKLITEKEQEIIFKESQIALHPKEAIICFHGFNGNMNGDLIPEITTDLALKNYYVFSFDCIGHGKNPVPLEKISFDIIFDEIDCVCNYISKKFPKIKINIYAASFGAFRFLSYIKNNNRNFNKIILFCPALTMFNILQKTKNIKISGIEDSKLFLVSGKMNKYLSCGFMRKMRSQNLLATKFNAKLFIILCEKDNLISKYSVNKFIKTNKVSSIYTIWNANHVCLNQIGVDELKKRVWQILSGE